MKRYVFVLFLWLVQCVVVCLQRCEFTLSVVVVVHGSVVILEPMLSVPI